MALFVVITGGCFKKKYEEIPPNLPSVTGLTLIDWANFDWSYSTLEGATNSLSQHKGKVIFLNFWATWCDPCKAEMPKLQNLYNGMKNTDMVFLLLSSEKADTLGAFLNIHNYDLPVYKAGQSVSDEFGVEAFPTTFIIDQSGRIIFKHVGAAKWDDESVIQFLRNLQHN